MKIIISPAKKMRVETDVVDAVSAPIFLENAKFLAKTLKSLDFAGLKNLLCCNEKLASESFLQYQNMDFDSCNTPAILAYDGLQYKYMAPLVFEESYFAYANKHLRILSGLYGVLKPLDGISPYRIEMQAKLFVSGCKNLYEYWGDKIYCAEFADEDCVIDLASKEYSKAVKKYFDKGLWVSVIFGEMTSGKVVEKGAYVKMARGEMVRFLCETKVVNPEVMKNFNRLGYKFCEKLSTEDKYVFIKGEQQ